MKRPAIEITEAVVGDDGVLSVFIKSPEGGTSALDLGTRAQGIILQALLGSTLDPLGPLSRRFWPIGLSRFRIDDDVGLSFLLSPQIGIHFTLDRSIAEILRELLDTFDDPLTWQAATLN